MEAKLIEKLIQDALQDGLHIKWWIYLLIFILIFLGSFIGSYIKQKGQNYATKDDFNSLLSQLKETTRITENIKLELASTSWVHQQNWVLKEKYYSLLLQHCYSLYSMSQMIWFEYWLGGDVVNEGEIKNSRYYLECRSIARDNLKKLREVQGAASIVVASQVNNSIDLMYYSIYRAEKIGLNDRDTAKTYYENSGDAYSTILKYARKDLFNKEEKDYWVL